MRDIILRCIQTDFKREHRTNQDRPKYFSSLPGKGEILAQDEATFLNSVSLLCEVFEHLRLADGTVINVLAVRQPKNKQKPDFDRQGADPGVLHLAVGLPLPSWSGPPWQATAGLTLDQDFDA